MIEYISGKIADINPATVTLETGGGVAYLLHITLPTFSILENQSESKLYVHESVREDAWTLYGFVNVEERELFRALVGVSGVGAASARMILSAIPFQELRTVIASADVKSLKGVKGIGAKTAERIIVDLKDKIKVDLTELVPALTAVDNAVIDEALEALIILGFARNNSQKVLAKLFKENPSITVENAIKKAMKLM